MTELVDTIASRKAGPGSPAILRLGQAGLAFKRSIGRLVSIDACHGDISARPLDGGVMSRRPVPESQKPGEIRHGVCAIPHRDRDHIDGRTAAFKAESA